MSFLQSSLQDESCAFWLRNVESEGMRCLVRDSGAEWFGTGVGRRTADMQEGGVLRERGLGASRWHGG